MTTTAPVSESQTFTITEEIDVRASIEQTFQSLVAHMGRLNETPEGTPLPMILELRPGGRWYRDLGGDNGHLWGFVQSVKRPALLEIWGPLFMSYAVVSNVQYRLSEVNGGTLIKFHHKAFGLIQEDHRQNVGKGWGHTLARIRARAEAGSR